MIIQFRYVLLAYDRSRLHYSSLKEIQQNQQEVFQEESKNQEKPDSKLEKNEDDEILTGKRKFKDLKKIKRSEKKSFEKG